MPSVEGMPIVISAPTLKEAHRRVKAEFGENAIIISTPLIDSVVVVFFFFFQY